MFLLFIYIYKYMLLKYFQLKKKTKKWNHENLFCDEKWLLIRDDHCTYKNIL